MNDKYERTETYHERYEHDIREFRKRIDQLEEEKEKLQAKLDEIEKLCIDRQAILEGEDYDVAEIVVDILIALRGEEHG